MGLLGGYDGVGLHGNGISSSRSGTDPPFCNGGSIPLIALNSGDFAIVAFNTPEQALHNALIKNATAAEKMRAGQCFGLVVTAWNLSRKGLSGRGLKFLLGSRIPAVT
ncbi:MAG: hypothetical protein AAGK37_19890 [Pseudomonadota bacterium]